MKSQAGFTLIEAMIALVILAIGLTGVLAFSTTAIRQAQNNSKWTNARFIAENELNQRSSLTTDQLETLVATAPVGQVSIIQDFTPYTVDFWYQQVGTQHYRITVRVDYCPTALVAGVCVTDPLPFFNAVSLSTEKNIYL